MKPKSAGNRAGGLRGKLREPKPPFPRQHQVAPGSEARLNPAPRYLAPHYRAAGKLEGKVALITGGDSGIGRAVAVLYAREGADLVLSFLPEESTDAHETQRTVLALGRRCVLAPADLTAEKAAQQLVERTVREFGRLDILVSNAAHQSHKESVTQVTAAELRETYETNVFACIRLVQAALNHLQPGSAIIVTSSETGLLGSKGLQDYSSTKGALNALVKTLAPELVQRGIRINAVAPGPVWTPLNPSDKGRTSAEVANFGKDTPMQRPAQPEELSPAYVFLASEADASYITGIILPVMGGTTIGG
jgi:NAD(P)-dependent dehydrogenase (short-subunit alcohol dehydrogenase family)